MSTQDSRFDLELKQMVNKTHFVAADFTRDFAPYMHDGRFATLREVVEFYNEDIQPHANLHPLLQDSLGNPIRLNLSEKEVDAMVDFLHTLTDTAFLADERWSDPFLR